MTSTTTKGKKKNPSLKEVFLQDAIPYLIKRINWFFSTKEKRGEFRRNLLIILIGIFWGILAVSIPEYTPSANPPLSEPWARAFNPYVLRRLLIIAFTFWRALEIAAKYLDDVFELDDIETAESYLLQASLANRYSTIEIKEGKIPDKALDSTIYLIGGPGNVKVHLDSVALFEKYDGTPRIIDATSGNVSLDRFERLRKVISLRDHIEELEVSARTKDGIPVTASGIKVKYHIYRGNAVQTLKKPYPYDAKAIEKLVYGQSVAQNIPTKTEERTTPEEKPKLIGLNRHRETFSLAPGIFKGKLANFIGTKYLSEFLATTSDPELQIRAADEKKLEETARLMNNGAEENVDNENQREATSADGEGQQSGQQSAPPSFYTRDQISQSIKDQVNQASKNSGLEIEWVDIGTWELPENAKTIREQHREAWKISLENLGQKNPKAIGKIEKEAKIKTLREILLELILIAQQEDLRHKPDSAVVQMLMQYHQHLTRVTEICHNRGIRRPDSVHKAIELIDAILGRGQWVS